MTFIKNYKTPRQVYSTNNKMLIIAEHQINFYDDNYNSQQLNDLYYTHVQNRKLI